MENCCLYKHKTWLTYMEEIPTFNPLTHGLFEVRYLTACGLNRPQICGRISQDLCDAHRNRQKSAR
jgi:hypothetical protein